MHVFPDVFYRKINKKIRQWGLTPVSNFWCENGGQWEMWSEKRKVKSEENRNGGTPHISSVQGKSGLAVQYVHYLCAGLPPYTDR